MKRALSQWSLCLSTSALAQMKISGPATAVDGNTLRMIDISVLSDQLHQFSIWF
jgi:hypothetical protein